NGHQARGQSGQEAIQTPSSIGGTIDSQRNGNDQGHQYRQHSNLDGHWQPLHDVAQHWSTGQQRVTKIAGEHTTHPAEVTDKKTVLEAVPLIEDLDLFSSCGWPKNSCRWVSGHEVDQCCGSHGYDEQDGHNSSDLTHDEV